MGKRWMVMLLFGIFCAASASSQYRSSRDIFPAYDEAQRERLFSSGGILKTAHNSKTLSLLPPALSGMRIEERVLERDLPYLVESLLVIPDARNPAHPVDIYNALNKVQGLKGRVYRSHNRGRDVPLFEDAARMESARKLSPIPDPPNVRTAPSSETLYIRLKDVNFGNSYYRADITVDQRGLLYRLANFKTISYLFIPVIKENNFIAQLYFEPLSDGVLVYSVAGANVSDFVASKIDISSAIQKRLEVILGWVVDGIKAAP